MLNYRFTRKNGAAEIEFQVLGLMSRTETKIRCASVVVMTFFDVVHAMTGSQ